MALALAFQVRGEEELHCAEWVQDAQCLKNAAFMFQSCEAECARDLADLSAECEEWASLEECDRNPAFMSLNCNRSCTATIQSRLAGDSKGAGQQPDSEAPAAQQNQGTQPVNSPTATAEAGRSAGQPTPLSQPVEAAPVASPSPEPEDPEAAKARAAAKSEELRLAAERASAARYAASRSAYPFTGSIFYRTLPVTFTLVLVLITAYRQQIGGRTKGSLPLQPTFLDRLPGSLKVFAERFHGLQLAYFRLGGPPVDLVGRALVGMYYVNEAVAYGEDVRIDLYRGNIGRIFRSVHASFDFAQLLLPAIVAALVVGRGSTTVSSLLMVDVIKDVFSVGGRILNVWMHARLFYVNELMIKKLSMLGCTLLMVASSTNRDPPTARKKSSSHSGLLLADGSAGADVSVGMSLLLLAARLLVAVLFMYVGVQEVHRILSGRSPYAAGDAHDTLWPKIVELVFVLPFILGYRTRGVCQVLATTLSLEAILVWTFWLSPGQSLRVVSFGQELRILSHMREHFCTNMAVAGGLLLMQEHGGGRFTLDCYMKKHD